MAEVITKLIGLRVFIPIPPLNERGPKPVTSTGVLENVTYRAFFALASKHGEEIYR